MRTITDAELAAMFEHYIVLTMYNQRCRSDSQDGLYSAGELRECERWLKLFGMDTSYEHIQKIIQDKEKTK